MQVRIRRISDFIGNPGEFRNISTIEELIAIDTEFGKEGLILEQNDDCAVLDVFIYDGPYES